MRKHKVKRLNKWQQYEKLKKVLLHLRGSIGVPNLSSQEYEKAIKKLAKRLKI